MRAALLHRTLLALFTHQRTVCVEGPPGGGKTTIFHQVAKELKVPLVVLHMPTMLVEDFGILFPKDDTDELAYRLPHWFPVKGQSPDKGILLFDDRNQAGADLQKVLANICQSRTLHGAQLPDGWMVASTGNRQSDKAGANRVLTHMRNRETVLELETHLDDWRDWANSNGVSPEVVSFISFRPGLLHDFDPNKDQNPSPRSWAEGVSELLDSVPQAALLECTKGAVGEGCAAEFMGFLGIYRGLPDVDKYIHKPTAAATPTDPTVLYALVGAVAHRVCKENLKQVIKIAHLMPTEFSVLMMGMIIKRDPWAAANPAFNKWIDEVTPILAE